MSITSLTFSSASLELYRVCLATYSACTICHTYSSSTVKGQMCDKGPPTTTAPTSNSCKYNMWESCERDECCDFFSLSFSAEVKLFRLNDFLFSAGLDNINLFKVLKYCKRSELAKKVPNTSTEISIYVKAVYVKVLISVCISTDQCM